MMPDFPVSEAKRRNLLDRMNRLGVQEKDMKESFTRSSGPGGQNVNKVETCVVLKHLPTGVTIRYQVSRSQALNRFMARRLLIDELEARRMGAESARQRTIWQIRKRKARISRRAKKRMLEAKRLHSLKKQLRGPVDY